MPKSFIRYQHDRLHARGLHAHNWAVRWSRVPNRHGKRDEEVQSQQIPANKRHRKVGNNVQSVPGWAFSDSGSSCEEPHLGRQIPVNEDLPQTPVKRRPRQTLVHTPSTIASPRDYQPPSPVYWPAYIENPIPVIDLDADIVDLEDDS